MDSNKIGRRVVCAANSNGRALLVGVRHWDTAMHAQASILFSSGVMDTYNDFVQGFLDNHEVFMDRKEAWNVAEAAGQIIRRVGGDEDGTLFSENLY